MPKESGVKLDTSRFLMICKRCRHQWIKRTVGLPQVCPFCGSRKWDEENEPPAKDLEGPLETIVVPPSGPVEP